VLVFWRVVLATWLIGRAKITEAFDHLRLMNYTNKVECKKADSLVKTCYDAEYYQAFYQQINTVENQQHTQINQE
jgi:hypothetical protein